VARPQIREAVFELLADGVWRTADQIGAELQRKYGFASDSVRSYMSHLANLRYIERRWHGRRYSYRRTDLETAAA
jgi:predicted transcriptional regulator